MEQLEDMKTMWAELNSRISYLEEENRRLAQKVMSQSLRSSQEKLVKKYNLFIIVECIMVIYTLFFVFLNPHVVEKYRLVTGIYWCAFFLIEISIDFYLKEKVRAIDIYNSPVSEIARRAANNWKLHKLAIVFGLPVAVGACILFALLIDANKFTILGMMVGGVVGFAIGLRQLFKFRKHYYNLQSSE